MTSEPAVVHERRDDVLVLRIDRPAQRNALTSQTLEELAAGLDRADADPQVRAVVVTGGTRVFASGADIRELRDTAPIAYLRSRRRALWQRFTDFPKPLVAAAAGPVLGGGCELALLCDLVVAADSAMFGQPEIRLGIIPGAGGTQRWGRVTGRYRAAEVVLLAQPVSAWTAWQWGLVHEVVPRERVVHAGVATAVEMARFSPAATMVAKSALRTAEETGLTQGLAHERGGLATLLSTADHTEGTNAFLEKRSPHFTGE
ncbi:enoyl-CoA hydratase-related protein [Salinactinospora qingdaonensis]|uniref:Enoyl-CoA hydratase-related protein n=1 Tax=Salinactinospora qingdaonensis TaxID=702744 RepID=A0ABP7F548_9ACTN